MKTVLSLIFFYILASVCGIAFCGFLFMICQGLHFFVAGQALNVFSFDLFYHGVLYSIPGVCVLVHLLSVLLLLRSKNSKKLNVIAFSFVAYIVLGLITWCFIFPQTVALSRNFSQSDLTDAEISTGYFRETKEGVCYYTKIYGDKADGIFIDRDGNIQFILEMDAKKIACDDYADVLVQKAVNMPLIMSYPMKIYMTMIEAAKMNWALGKFAWLSFATMALALFALFGVQFFSSWKLVNAVLVLLGGSGIIFVNFLFYSHKLSEVVLKIQEKLPSLFSFDNSLIACVNILIAVLLSIFGILALIRSVRRNGESRI